MSQSVQPTGLPESQHKHSSTSLSYKAARVIALASLETSRNSLRWMGRQSHLQIVPGLHRFTRGDKDHLFEEPFLQDDQLLRPGV